MKKQIFIATLLKAGKFFCIFLLGSAVGVVSMWQYTLHFGMQHDDGTGSSRLITDKIAIVNLDEGITIHDEKVNYAEKLIINLDDNFLFTGLEDARQGYTTGIYAGYLIIPATFSESVVSLNHTPVRAEISYVINDNLEEDIKETVIYDVLTLMSDINDSISYMYVHSVLDDFHTAQDEADTVMNNDLKEKEAIDAVQANDLVALVPVTELTVVENTIEPVDISEYMMQNMKFTNQVGQKYTDYLMASRSDHMRINEEALLLMAEMSNMSGIMAGSNFGQGEDGSSIYQEGAEELDTLLEEYNISLGEKEAEISENVLAIYEDINLYMTAYDRTIEAYLADNKTAYDNTLKALEDLLAEYQKKYILVSAEEMQKLEDTLAAQNEMLAEQETMIMELQESEGENSNTDSNINTDRMDDADISGNTDITDDTGKISDTDDVYSGDDAGENSTEDNSGDANVSKDDISNHEAEKSQTGDTQPEGGQGESGMPSFVETEQYIKTSLRSQTISEAYKVQNCTSKTEQTDETKPEEETLEDLQDEILKEFGKNYFLFSGYLLDEEGEIVLDADGNKILLTSLLEKYRKDLNDPVVKTKILEEEVGTLTRMNSGILRTCINEKILMPIQENVNSFTDAVMAQYAVEQEQLLNYNEAIMDYNPVSYINYEEIQILTNAMMENGTNLSAAILDTDMQQMEYVSDVYAATREDLFTLQDNIIQAKENSDKAVEEGLQDLKDTKNANSDINQQILYDFSTKLPYTRLGSLEYVQAYEFMVNPVSAINTAAQGQGGSIRKDSVRTESDSVNVQAKRRADYQNISIIICLVICVIIVANTIKYHFHKKEESYETD